MIARRSIVALSLWLFTACAAQHRSETPPITVILVRHADRASAPPTDPPLTSAGIARAQDLAVALRDAGVQAIITTQFRRTQATAAPLADLLALTPEVVPDTGPSHARAVARLIFEHHKGQTVLVVGHGHTIPAIIGALGAGAPPKVCESVYDRLYVVTVPATGRPRLLHARYGLPSTPDSACVAAGNQ